MKVFVQMNNDRTCMLKADRIDYSDEDYVFIYNGEQVVGVFDKAYLACAYMTEPSKEKPV